MTLDPVIQSLLLLPLWGAAAEGAPGPSDQLMARPAPLLVRVTPEGTQPRQGATAGRRLVPPPAP
ncbi:MAG: hypothetical protein RIQ83_3012 [Pseudomonadota bacterium]|jgi:hypothetical protein